MVQEMECATMAIVSEYAIQKAVNLGAFPTPDALTCSTLYLLPIWTDPVPLPELYADVNDPFSGTTSVY
jgi:hypothetical protein